jgi:type VI protein secretion system component VasF
LKNRIDTLDAAVKAAGSSSPDLSDFATRIDNLEKEMEDVYAFSVPHYNMPSGDDSSLLGDFIGVEDLLNLLGLLQDLNKEMIRHDAHVSEQDINEARDWAEFLEQNRVMYEPNTPFLLEILSQQAQTLFDRIGEMKQWSPMDETLAALEHHVSRVQSAIEQHIFHAPQNEASVASDTDRFNSLGGVGTHHVPENFLNPAEHLATRFEDAAMRVETANTTTEREQVDSDLRALIEEVHELCASNQLPEERCSHLQNALNQLIQENHALQRNVRRPSRFSQEKESRNQPAGVRGYLLATRADVLRSNLLGLSLLGPEDPNALESEATDLVKEIHETLESNEEELDADERDTLTGALERMLQTLDEIASARS